MSWKKPRLLELRITDKNVSAYRTERYHDYNPEWDYELLPKRSAAVKKVGKIAAKMERELKGELPFKRFKVYCAVLGKHKIGMYIDGTHSEPVILVDWEEIVKGAASASIDVEVGVVTTILHELGHACQESAGKEFDEEEAENFADEYWRYGQLTPIWEAA